MSKKKREKKKKGLDLDEESHKKRRNVPRLEQTPGHKKKHVSQNPNCCSLFVSWSSHHRKESKYKEIVK